MGGGWLADYLCLVVNIMYEHCILGFIDIFQISPLRKFTIFPQCILSHWHCAWQYFIKCWFSLWTLESLVALGRFTNWSQIATQVKEALSAIIRKSCWEMCIASLISSKQQGLIWVKLARINNGLTVAMEGTLYSAISLSLSFSPSSSSCFLLQIPVLSAERCL